MTKKGNVKPGYGQDITQYSVEQLRERARQKRADDRPEEADQMDGELARRAQLWDDLEEMLG